VRDTAFIFVITAHNCQPFIHPLVDSLKRQTYDNWRAVFVDDCSTDGTVGTLRAALATRDLADRIVVQESARRRYKACNVYRALRSCSEDSDVIVMLDGDDRLADNFALEILKAEYERGWHVVWANWGGSDGSRGGSYHLTPLLGPRRQPFVTSHLFSFRKWLFDAVLPRDLKDDHGDWFRAGCDLAIAWPVLEQTIRRKHIERLLCIYNRANPLSIDKAGRKYRRNVNEQQARTQAILSRRSRKTAHRDIRFLTANLPYFAKAAVLNTRLVKKYWWTYRDIYRIRRSGVDSAPRTDSTWLSPGVLRCGW